MRIPVLPDSELLRCGCCLALCSRYEVRHGRGRSVGEHPDHYFGPCGHSLSFYGVRAAGRISRSESRQLRRRCHAVLFDWLFALDPEKVETIRQDRTLDLPEWRETEFGNPIPHAAHERAYRTLRAHLGTHRAARRLRRQARRLRCCRECGMIVPGWVAKLYVRRGEPVYCMIHGPGPEEPEPTDDRVILLPMSALLKEVAA